MTQRLSSRTHAPVVVAAVLVVVSLGAVACFSERATDSGSLATTNCTVPTTAAGAAVVFIRAFTFDSPTVRVKAGNKVAWVNCEPTPIPHTSTSDGGAWDSGSLAQDASFVRTFPSAGTFPYHCAIHPSMKATVIVE
ncbi:MAG: amidase [Gemmatimonadetes bacterium]|jgi:plastocyanin|nr:amidase [Gemmatimonadota bacterium]